jgi:hypothetical protein
MSLLRREHPASWFFAVRIGPAANFGAYPA